MREMLPEARLTKLLTEYEELCKILDASIKTTQRSIAAEKTVNR